MAGLGERGKVAEPISNIASLLMAHQGGDPAAFPQIWDQYRGDLWSFLVNRIPERADAEDLFQEISFKVYKNLDRLQDPARFRSWLFSIALNTLRNFYRKKPMLSLNPEEEAEPPWEKNPGAFSMTDPHQLMENRERLQCLRHCMLTLPERDREILLLDAMAGLPQQEIAARFELNLNTVKTIIRRAKIKLARLMTEVDHG